MSQTALSTRTGNSPFNSALLPFVGVALAGLGGAALYFMSIEPLMSIAAARSWTPAVCTIESSAVKQHDGRIYSVVVSYSYTFQGKLFHSDRYNFLACPSNLRGWRDRVVAGYPPGLVATCYVNPRRPSEAVLNRNLHPDFLWGQCNGPPLLIPLLLFVTGVALLGGSVWSRRRERQMARGVLSQANAPDRRPGQLGAHDGPITLEPEIRRGTQAVDRFYGAALWNGGIAYLVYGIYARAVVGRFGWFEILFLLFLVPFLTDGFSLVGEFGRSLLALFEPEPVLMLSRPAIPLGGKAELSWSIDGRWQGLQSFSIRLKGTEQVRSSGRGRSRQHPFHDQLVAERTRFDGLAGGTCVLTIPADTMHSFKSKHNSIVWQLSVEERFPRRPPVCADYPIQVTPHD